MKMLVKRTPISTALPFVLDDLKAYSRVDFSHEDSVLTQMGMAAAAEVEQFAQVALLAQTIRVVMLDLVFGSGIALPIGPLIEGSSASVAIDGESLEGFEIIGGIRPYLVWPGIVRGQAIDRVQIEYQAGFGSAEEAIPDDLRQAILDHVALVYSTRAPEEAKTLARSSHLARVGARYRGVSV
jgi:uncharacterized phiE125 gp8 family phage protein